MCRCSRTFLFLVQIANGRNSTPVCATVCLAGPANPEQTSPRLVLRTWRQLVVLASAHGISHDPIILLICAVLHLRCPGWRRVHLRGNHHRVRLLKPLSLVRKPFDSDALRQSQGNGATSAQTDSIVANAIGMCPGNIYSKHAINVLPSPGPFPNFAFAFHCDKVGSAPLEVCNRLNISISQCR